MIAMPKGLLREEKRDERRDIQIYRYIDGGRRESARERAIQILCLYRKAKI